MSTPDEDALALVRTQLEQCSMHLERLGARRPASAGAEQRELEREIAEIRAARDAIARRLESARAGTEEGAAEGLLQLVDDVSGRLHALARRIGIED